MMRSAAEVFCKAAAHSVRFRPRLALSEWADRFRVLSAKASAERGRWRTRRTPFLREIMDCLSEHSPVRSVTIKKSTQVGCTEVLLNWIGYHIHRELGPMLVVIPTDKLQRKWVLQRLQPMLKDTDCLAEMHANRSRDSANSLDLLDFDNSQIISTGSNSPANLSSMPIRHFGGDEVDRYPWQVGTEGDPLGIIRRRMITFPDSKELLISSPTIKDASRIDEEYEKSDQRSYLVPCPHCDHYQKLIWENLHYQIDPVDAHKVTRAVYVCSECGSEIEEHYKPKMLEAGRWVAQHPERKKRGYHINALYAPIGLGDNWVTLAEIWLEAHKDPVKLKRFVNTILGEAWEDQARKVKSSELAERGEPYGLRDVPPGILIVTAGVDVQDDRLAVMLLGHGPNDCEAVIDYHEIIGDPGRRKLWAELTDYINNPLVNTYGRDVVISATAIDTGGHYTEEVYKYCRDRKVREVMAIKGASKPGQAILSRRPSYVDIDKRNRTESKRNKMALWSIGTDTGKSNLWGRLIGDADVEPDERRLRFSHELDLEFYLGLTAEVFDPERKKWIVRSGRRNEPVDCYNYAKAASMNPRVAVHRKKPRDWQRLADLLERPLDDAETSKPKPRKRRRSLPGGVA